MNSVRCFVACLCCCCSISAVKFDLTRTVWWIENANGTLRTRSPVPVDVYLALYNGGVTGDPYYRDNDRQLRYLSYQNWTFGVEVNSLAFDLPSVSYGAYWLVAEGLDSVSSLFFNGAFVGSTENMFRTYVFDVTRHRRSEKNRLSIEFASPVKYAARSSRQFRERFGYRVPLDCRPTVERENGECNANFVRKVESSFGWDWSPTFPTMGIWRDIYIVAFDTCSVRSFSAVPSLVGTEEWQIRADFRMLCAKDVEASFKVTFDALPFEFAKNGSKLSKGVNEIRLDFSLPSEIGRRLKLWWPNGYGEQTLYEARGEFSAEHESEHKILEADFSSGLTFYFKINGVPIFLKGSNWVPMDSFLSRVSRDDLTFLVTSMKAANMNTIRINGVGIYESDDFYALCDQLGIAIWHDMMFASNLYPADDDFLENVRREAEDQTNRLKHHPSIIVWSANNENEWGLRAGWFPLDAPFETYRRDYVRLYNDTVYGVVRGADPNRPFVLSCPSNGLNTTRSGGVDTDPQSPLFGDIHFYTQYWDAWNWRLYPVARCVTEWGYQSLPSLETLSSVLEPDDLRYFSIQMLHRQHSPKGDLLMLQQIFIQFNLLRLRRGSRCEPDGNCAENGFFSRFRLGDLIYLNQIHQAMAYKTAAEHFRRWRSRLNETSGQGLTMCALYWQLNDNWQGVSLSGIDYGLRWKFLHYYAKRFYSPVLVSPYVDGRDLRIDAVSDLRTPVRNCTLLLRVFAWNSFRPILSYAIPLAALKPLAAENVYSAALASFATNPETARVIFRVELTDSGGRVLSDNVLFPDKFYSVPPEDYGSVVVKSVRLKAVGVFEVVVKASGGAAPFVWLHVKGVRGYFSENGFVALAPETVVKFHAWRNSTTLRTVESNLEVTSLRDLYF